MTRRGPGGGCPIPWPTPVGETGFEVIRGNAFPTQRRLIMAAVDYFLKIDGIEGEATDPDHPGEIELAAWNWGEQQSGTHAAGSGGGAGKVSMNDFHFTMELNKASPKLMLACAKGEHIKKAVLTCRKAGGTQEKYFTVTMSD